MITPFSANRLFSKNLVCQIIGFNNCEVRSGEMKHKDLAFTTTKIIPVIVVALPDFYPETSHKFRMPNRTQLSNLVFIFPGMGKK